MFYPEKDILATFSSNGEAMVRAKATSFTTDTTFPTACKVYKHTQISMISNKYGKANNKYQDEYDPSMPSKYITYLDANNLYGWAMSQPIPCSEFKWLTDKQISNFCINDIPDDFELGYILDVDLEYPTVLHNKHSDYPLAPESVIISDDMLSPYSQKLKKNSR